VNQVVGGYVRGTLILATLIGVLVGFGMALLHVRYALLLGILAFFMEFVPVLGVMVSGVVCVAVALFTGWLSAVFVAIYFVVVHVIEGDVVGPRIMGKAVGIHPGVAIVALVAGSELFGIWGALFGAPLAGLVQAIFLEEVVQGDAAHAHAPGAFDEVQDIRAGRFGFLVEELSDRPGEAGQELAVSASGQAVVGRLHDLLGGEPLLLGSGGAVHAQQASDLGDFQTGVAV